MNPLGPIDLGLGTHGQGPATDLYQLTMMAGYRAAGIDRTHAVFEMFTRRLPGDRSFLVFAGLEQALDAVTRLRFDADQVDAIRRWPVFEAVDPRFFDDLRDFRFSGDIWAVPEGTVVFAGEPWMRVSGPLAECQLLETLLLAAIGYPTLVASKAARIVGAAQGRGLFDFGARRGHGLQASMMAARAAYIAGFAGTSQVEAARRLGIPAVGTMAHSWVQSFPDEGAAFRAFAEVFPRPTLLVDTYRTARGVRHAAQVDPPIRAIRIDSGDLLVESTEARRILDELGRREVRIVGSGDLDEREIARLVAACAPIDEFGVGTQLITSADAPALALVYKLTEIGGRGRIKLSASKRWFPHAKQIDRRCDDHGRMVEDLVIGADEPTIGRPLLERVVANGEPVKPIPTLDAIRRRCERELALLPPHLRTLDPAEPEHPIRVSDQLRRAADLLVAEMTGAG